MPFAVSIDYTVVQSFGKKGKNTQPIKALLHAAPV